MISIDGLVGMAANSAAEHPSGTAFTTGYATKADGVFFNADGEWLIVPEQGRLRIATELGGWTGFLLEIAVIPRGPKFRGVAGCTGTWVCG